MHQGTRAVGSSVGSSAARGPAAALLSAFLEQLLDARWLQPSVKLAGIVVCSMVIIILRSVVCVYMVMLLRAAIVVYSN